LQLAEPLSHLAVLNTTLLRLREASLFLLVHSLQKFLQLLAVAAVETKVVVNLVEEELADWLYKTPLLYRKLMPYLLELEQTLKDMVQIPRLLD
jgi:hypothetical protein